MKKNIQALSLILTIVIILNFSFIKSVVIMYFYSQYHEINSIPAEKGFKANIPGGWHTVEKDWYPFVLTFNDEYAARDLGEEIKLTILYNFGGFKNNRSLLYDEDSPYYSAFYGAYIVESLEKGRIYGFDGENIKENEIIKLANHDLDQLVLKSIGCNNSQVDFISEETKNVDYIQYENWVRIDGKVNTNSPLHTYSKNHTAYIQYGRPPADFRGEDYKPINLNGRIYCRYFPEYHITLFLYAIAPSIETIESIDKKFLSETTIDAR